MTKFDDLLEKIVGTTKRLAGVAGEKTAQLVEIGKLRYRQNQVERELKRSYEKLGAIVYEAKRNDQDFSEIVEKAILGITELNTELDLLDELIALVGKPEIAQQDAPEPQESPFEPDFNQAEPFVVAVNEMTETADDVEQPTE